MTTYDRAINRDLGQIVSPAAAIGTGPIVTVPAGQRWDFRSALATYISSATAGTRQFGVEVRDTDDTVFARLLSPVTFATASTRWFSMGSGIPEDAAHVGGRILFPLPKLVLLPGQDLRFFDTQAVDGAGDSLAVCVNVDVEVPWS